ncbi:hypothetical protein SHKM778_69970 [Streptomyces sp. KM77-8]|uniref:Uncharacterized protein n=1 Tax=Streptomyces haneummycinicus TaxID=3074435 RepID=A0AAT9HSJ1_9ACTN
MGAADTAGHIDAEHDREAPAPRDDEPVGGAELHHLPAGTRKSDDGHGDGSDTQQKQDEGAQEFGEHLTADAFLITASLLRNALCHRPSSAEMADPSLPSTEAYVDRADHSCRKRNSLPWSNQVRRSYPVARVPVRRSGQSVVAEVTRFVARLIDDGQLAARPGVMEAPDDAQGSGNVRPSPGVRR